MDSSHAKSYLQKPDGKRNAKFQTRISLKGHLPRPNTSYIPSIRLGAFSRPVLARERPRPVPHRVEAAAVESILDASDRVSVVGAEETLPGRRQKTVSSRGGQDVGEEECR
jgi:hypothetical protein